MKTPKRKVVLPSLEEFHAECERWGERPIQWQLKLAQAISVCGLIQLALRHPHLGKSPSAALGKDFIMSFIEAIPAEFPALKQTLHAGFDPAFDVETKSK